MAHSQKSYLRDAAEEEESRGLLWLLIQVASVRNY